MREIRSADNPRYRRALKLQQSARDRRKSGLAILDGVHLVRAYLDQAGTPEDLFVSRSRVADPEIARVLVASPRETSMLSDALFAKLSSVASATGVLAVVQTPRRPAPDSPGLCVLLEDIQDPGNLGSILRSAAAAAVPHVFLSRNCADAWSPRVLRAGMGAHFMLDIHEDADLENLARLHRGRVLAAALEGTTPVYALDLRGEIAFVFGNEGAGITPALRQAAHATVSIPMPGPVESLNVAAAAAVCLFERVRQVAESGKGSA